MNIENRLKQLLGDDAGYIHTGRSRNDQVITDFKLWIKSSSKDLDFKLSKLIKTILKDVPVKAATPNGFSLRLSRFFLYLPLSL